MEPIKTIQEAKRELKKVTTCAAGSDRFIARCIPLLMELFEKQLKTKSRGPKKPSEYNLFVGEQMKQGKSLQEVAKMWKAKKEMLKA